MNNSYALGTEVTLTGTFRDLNGALTDPTTVTCEIMQPNRQIVTVMASQSSPGVYTAAFTPSQIGGHNYKFQGTGNCNVAAYSGFNVTGTFQ